jgi:Fuc2NAc and GlcNAc transferase
MTLAVLAFAVLIVAAVIVGWMCRAAGAHGFVATPNSRSSHSRPTPTAGGAGIFLASLAGFAALYAFGDMPLRLFAALAVGGSALAIVGFVDDRRPLDAGLRLVVHLAAGVWAVWCVGGAPPLEIGGRVIEPGIVGDVLAVLTIAWWVNLFNFMDGIDGIAGAQAAFMALAGAALTFAAGGSFGVVAAGVVIAAAALGFLRWNWPPSRIFMGDVGSGFLGFVLAVIALQAAHERPVLLWAWVILGAVFIADATVTLVRRMARREAVHTAHRTHAYQWLSRRWNSHGRVTVAVMAVNVLGLLPAAVLVLAGPVPAPAVAAGSLALVAVVAVLAGAGRPECR